MVARAESPLRLRPGVCGCPFTSMGKSQLHGSYKLSSEQGPEGPRAKLSAWRQLLPHERWLGAVGASSVAWKAASGGRGAGAPHPTPRQARNQESGSKVLPWPPPLPARSPPTGCSSSLSSVSSPTDEDDSSTAPTGRLDLQHLPPPRPFRTCSCGASGKSRSRLPLKGLDTPRPHPTPIRQRA